MLQLFQPRPDLKAAHIFADHLEATLDLAEELELLYLIPADDERAPGRDVLVGLDRTGAFVERIESIELAIAAKLEQARAAARRIANADARLSAFTKLFHAGTQPLVDLWPALADPGRRIFDSGHDPLTFLQARGAVDESRSSLEGQRFIGTGSDFLLLGTVKLGAFIELCDTCLKALDRHYQIYEDDADWEADRARTLDILRENRDEAIRVALGAKPSLIDSPVEIVASDAVDEAIELIEALTFPEERRFAHDHPLIEEAPLSLGPESMAAGPPIEIVEDAEASLPAPPVKPDLPVDFAAEAPAETPAASISSRIAQDNAGPAAKPGLLAPIAAAGRSLAAILARRKAAAAEAAAQKAQAQESTSDAGTPAAETDIAPDATAEAIGSVAESPAPEAAIDSSTNAVPIEGPVTDAAQTAKSVATQLTAVRRRLLDVIAARARSEPEVAGFEPSTAEPAALQESEPSPDLLARTFDVAATSAAIVLSGLVEEAPAEFMGGAELAAISPEPSAGAVDAIEPILPATLESEPAAAASVADESPLPAVREELASTQPPALKDGEIEVATAPSQIAVAEIAVASEPEPIRRKRPRRKSHRKAASRKRRTKRA